MANQFIARKGLIALSNSEITGSLSTTSNLDVDGSGSFSNNNFLIGTNVGGNPASGFNSTFEFQNGPSTYSSQLVFRPKGNQTNYNENYWGTIRWNPANESGLTILAGNYKKHIVFGRGIPSNANPPAFAKLNDDGLRIQSSYIQNIATADERLHVVGNAKITGFITASGNLITDSNITASGHVSASTYYGDGSNLTGIETDPFPYTGSAVISGSLEVIGDITGSNFLATNGIKSTGDIDSGANKVGYVSSWNQYMHPQGGSGEFRFNNGSGGGFFYTWVQNGAERMRLSTNNYLGIGTASPQERLHVAGNAVITGSNSLAGNYALKVTNTSGDNILNIENNNEITLGTTPYTPNDSSQVSNSNVYARGGIYVANTGNNFGMSYEGNRIKYNNGLSRPTFSGTSTGFQSSGELIGTTVKGSNGLQVGGGLGKEVSVVGGNDLDITFNGYGGASLTSGQSWIRLNGPNRTSRKGLLELHAGTNPTNANITLSTNTSERMRITHSGSVGIGLTDPQTNLHVSGAVSASTYYGDGSNLTGVNIFPYTGSAIITGSLQVIGNTNFDGILDLNNGSNTPIIGTSAGGGTNSATIGYQAGQYQTGTGNVSIGYRAMQGVSGSSTVTYNTAVGYQALKDNTTGGENTAVGFNALSGVSAGSRDTAVGYLAGSGGGGGGSVYIGSRATGNYGYSVAVGYYAQVLGSGATAIGRSCSAKTNGVHIGGNGAAGQYSVSVGQASGNTNSSQGVNVGWSAGNGTTGGNNISIGYQAGRSGGTGGRNINIGHESGFGNTGSYNTYVGYYSGRSSQGNSNVFIGYTVGQNANVSNKLYIDNSNTSTPLIYGEFDNNKVLINGELSASSAISASTYYGDGSNLTGISSDFPYTGSAIISGSLEVIGDVNVTEYISGSESAKFKVGTYPFGYNTFEGLGTVTGSGIIVSSSLPDDHYAMVKIGDTELIDISTGSLLADHTFTIHNVDNFQVTSGSEPTDISTNKLFEHTGDTFKIYSKGNSTPIFTASSSSIALQGVDVNILPSSGVPYIKTPNISTAPQYVPVFDSDPSGTSGRELKYITASTFTGGGESSAYHTWIGGRGENASQASFGTQWRGGMSGNSLGGSFVVNADTTLVTVSSGTPSVGDTISANNYKIVTALIHPAMAFTTIEWYGHFRAYNSACDGNEQHMEIWTLDDVNDLAGFGTTTLTFRGGNQWTYDSTSSTIKPIITSGSISHTGTETTAFVVVSHVPTNPASSMRFVYKFDFTVT